MPRTFREAVQWMHWYQMAAKMFNSSGSLGRIDQILWPYYNGKRATPEDAENAEKTFQTAKKQQEETNSNGINHREHRDDNSNDKETAREKNTENSNGEDADVPSAANKRTVSREEAIFLLACHLINDTSYSQLGGPDEEGGDSANELSFLVLEAAHRLRIPANIGVCVGERLDDKLLRRGVEILFEDKTGIPKFLGVDNTSAGFARNGFDMSVARQRAYSGCHWSALPGANTR